MLNLEVNYKVYFRQCLKVNIGGNTLHQVVFLQISEAYMTIERMSWESFQPVSAERSTS